jgi:hypothetical protein
MRTILLLAMLTLASCASQPKPQTDPSDIAIIPAPVGGVIATPLPNAPQPGHTP